MRGASLLSVRGGINHAPDLSAKLYEMLLEAEAVSGAGYQGGPCPQLVG